MRKQFFRNVLPSVMAFAFSGAYQILDGIFIGRNVGDAGLAAINIAYPITAIVQAVGTGIGMGGAIHIAVNIGAGDKEKVKKYLGNTLSLTLILCFGVTLLLALSSGGLLRTFGADGEILTLAKEYIHIIVFGATFQILGMGMVPIIRNLNGAFVAMVSMIAGFGTNIFLDYLLVGVCGYGMRGAAFATTFGQLVTSIPCILFLLAKRKFIALPSFIPALHIFKRIISVGISPFGLILSPNIVLLIINKNAMAYGGENAVAAYAVTSYILIVLQLLLQGIGDGSQPLISSYYGENNRGAVQSVRRMTYATSFLAAIIFSIAVFFSRNFLPGFFGASEGVSVQVVKILPVFILSFVFYGFLRPTMSYFYATKKNFLSYILIYGEILLLFILMFILPPIMGLWGVWVSVAVSRGILAVAGGYLLKRQEMSNLTKGNNSECSLL